MERVAEEIQNFKKSKIQNFKKSKAEFQRSHQDAGGKPRNKNEDIFMSSPALSSSSCCTCSSEEQKSSDLPKVLQWVTDGGNNRNALNRPAVFPAFPFTALFILSKLLCKEQSFISFLALPAPSTGIRSTSLQHHCLYWRIKLSAALGNQAKPGKNRWV